jgi:hypothetical protein|tara:strand:+ start:166 stop:309 length:144 start_codon:yes stop_codon:yes gene_type:complete
MDNNSISKFKKLLAYLFDKEEYFSLGFEFNPKQQIKEIAPNCKLIFH